MKTLLLVFFFISLRIFAAPPEVEQHAAALRTILKQADEAYYNQHRSIMSDEAYDSLRAQFDSLLAGWPELSGEHPVGAPVGKTGRYIEHTAPVLGLQKIYSDAELEQFIRRTGDTSYCIEPKIDGLTVVLHYRNGFLVQAATRGDGETGCDVTAAMLASGAVPAKLNKIEANSPLRLQLSGYGKDTASTLIVRGEAFFTAPEFEKLGLKHPRNAASGTLMLTDFAEIARRNLSVQIFELLAADELPDTHSGAIHLIRAAGLPAIDSVEVPVADVIAAVEKMNCRRAELPFETDGIVVKMNTLNAAKTLGSTAQHPRSAVARKYKTAPVTAKLLAVEWSRSKTGRLIPVAVFEPVEISGATIRRASLYNVEHLRAMDLKIGDIITVIRSGGAVPEITGVLKEHRTGTEKEIPIEPQQTLMD
ncbi:MAG: hypothetical protein WC959_01370 [Kiritimatiellales bacterium]